MRKTRLILRSSRLLAPLLIVASLAGCAEGDAITADDVLDNMMMAMASERSRNSIQSLTATADCDGPDGAFETTVTSLRPDTVYFRQASERGIAEIWSTPERTWGGTAGEEYADLDPQVRNFVRGHEFHLMLLDIRSRFSGFALEGSETTGNADCFRVSMTDEAGEEASICVRAGNWLPAELVLNPLSAAGPVRIAFDDWRRLDGLNLFHSLELSESEERKFSYDYVDISVNTFAYEMRVPPPELPRVRPD